MSKLCHFIAAFALACGCAWTQPSRPEPNQGRALPSFMPLTYRGERLGVVAAPGASYPWKVLPNVFTITDLNYYDGKHRTCVMDLFLPVAGGDELGGKPRPVIFFVHGGGWSGGSRREVWWTGMPLEYATKGYVTVSVD